MSDRHISKRPRVKGPKRMHEFWCFFHQRFFEENKKRSHCIPKGCFEFNHAHYLTRMGMLQDAGYQASAA